MSEILTFKMFRELLTLHVKAKKLCEIVFFYDKLNDTNEFSREVNF